MHSPVKVIILGLTNSGKSTIAAILKKKDWFVMEIDDLAQMKNGGIWPESEATLDKLFKEVNQEVIKLKNVIFVTSFLELEELQKFHLAGFKVIELHASYDELVRRKIQRDGAPKDNYERFNRNYNNYQNLLKEYQKYISLSLDTTGVESEDLALQVEQELAR